MNIATALVKSTEAQAVGVGVQRAQFEHAIAILIGVPPAELTILPTGLRREVQAVPAGFAISTSRAATRHSSSGAFS